MVETQNFASLRKQNLSMNNGIRDVGLRNLNPSMNNGLRDIGLQNHNLSIYNGLWDVGLRIVSYIQWLNRKEHGKIPK